MHGHVLKTRAVSNADICGGRHFITYQSWNGSMGKNTRFIMLQKPPQQHTCREEAADFRIHFWSEWDSTREFQRTAGHIPDEHRVWQRRQVERTKHIKSPFKVLVLFNMVGASAGLQQCWRLESGSMQCWCERRHWQHDPTKFQLRHMANKAGLSTATFKWVSPQYLCDTRQEPANKCTHATVVNDQPVINCW